MERDSLTKAFEAYRQATIERTHVQRELQQTTEYYKQYTQNLQQQIEEQRLHILRLEAELRVATRRTSGEKCCETALGKQEVETLSSCDHHPDNTPSNSQQRKQFLDYAESLEMPPCALLMASTAENGEVLDTFQKLQGTLQLIQKLTRKQNDHLKKMYRGSDSANEPQFSMPIQCTDGTAEQAEGPFTSSIRSEVLGDELASSSLASRGACQEDPDFNDSLSKLSVRFPPPTDSEYEFLNSAPEKPMQPISVRKGLADVAGVSGTSEDGTLKFLYPSSVVNAASPSTSLSPEAVRGPQQALWSPKPCDAAVQGADDEYCTFCASTVPQGHMLSHLNSHFQKNASNGH
ncbi:TRAF family member-associated NF-kappa-B activator [Brienomyrus brachyistius]|uniref:TRAF family member-associated NF-kappa-B activator n=1 Tax=Brienomyrus brachyistius TaxID=42636 RepID=UPI0020B41579|nr:TRAF family member-associated NF-kappa-B activator [Brienomyrus brachyistius]XP_048873338.1 TRAF family member-associated NF-kappa-B activator [Brienomyrus brachyistius]